MLRSEAGVWCRPIEDANGVVDGQRRCVWGDRQVVCDEAYSGVTQDGTTGTPLVEIHVPLRIGREM